MNSIDWEKIQADFPVNENLIWLNNSGATPIPRPVLNTLTSWLENYSRFGILAKGTGRGQSDFYSEIKSSIYNQLAILMNAKPEEVVLVHNTAEAMNFISHGIDLKPGDEIIVLENEYPSNIYPWEHWRQKGVRWVTTPMADNPETFVTGFTKLISKRTRLVALSAVHWCTGFLLPLGQIGKICQENSIEFIVDASQGIGMINLDVKTQNIDYMAFAAWKWLMGPVGLGGMFISEKRLQSLKPIFKGTDSVVADANYFPYREELKPTADRFCYSTANFNDWVYFDASLKYLNSIGFENVHIRIQELGKYLSEGLKELGFDLVNPVQSSTGIVAASKPTVDSASVVKALKEKGIIAAERLGRIRFSPHIYNSFSQLDRVLVELSHL